MEHIGATIYLTVAYLSIQQWFIPLLNILESIGTTSSSTTFSSSSSVTVLTTVSSLFTVSSYTLFLFYGLLPMIVFYVYGTILGYIDLSSTMTDWRNKYKVQYKINITPDDYIQGITISLRNWLFIGIPWAYYLCYTIIPSLIQNSPYYSLLHSSSSKDIHHPTLLPTLLSFFYQFSIFLICEEILFYFSHRLLHTIPYLFRHIHLFHHTYSAPFGIAAIYAHPIEHLVSNVIPVASGSIVLHYLHLYILPTSYFYLLNGHIAITTIWVIAAILSTMTSHSGYCIPGMETPYFHDWHHEYGKENFGVLQIFDRLLHTDTKYRQLYKEGKLQVPRNIENRKKEENGKHK